MKIIVDDLIDSVSTAGGELDATNYPDDNVLSDYPGQAYIATQNPSSSFVFTVNASAAADGFFLSNWMADTLEYSVDNSTYTSLSTADNNFVSGNLNLKPGSDYWTRPFFIEVAINTTDDLRLRLQTTTDRKDTPLKGNAIYQFDVDSGTSGRFEDSSGNTINLTHHAGVLVGSHVDIAGTMHQVTSISGNGTETDSVSLSGSPVDGTINSIKNPCKIGILKMGSIETYENPSVGLQQSFEDFGVRQTSSLGNQNYIQRNQAKIYSGRFVSNVTNSDSFISLARAFRARPFACLLIDGTAVAQDEKSNYSIYAQFPELPSVSFGGQQGATRNINFRLREFL